MKHILFICFAIFFATGTLYAQDAAVISTEDPTHDFGKIKEADGDTSYTFKIENKGKAPLVITRVVPSCGCSTTEFTKEPIAPGETGDLTVTFDPKGRPGPFTKTINVYSNGKKGSFVLTIRGEVE